MPELRKDPIIDRWVIISSERGQRPVFLAEAGGGAKTGGDLPALSGKRSDDPSRSFCHPSRLCLLAAQ